MARVLVTGGTGTLGKPLVARLVDAGHEVRVLSRRRDPVVPTGVTAVQGDLATGQGVGAAAEGVDVVAHCASSPFRKTKATDVDGTRRLLEAVPAGGATHVVYVSIVGVDRNPFPYYRRKLEVEQLLGSSAVPSTIMRAAQFHDLIAAPLSLAGRMPVVLVPKGLRFQPVDAGEVADRMAELVDSPPGGRVTDFAGPEIRGIEDLAAAWLRHHGKSRRVVGFPLPGRAAAAFRAGAQLAPDGDRGRVTFEQYLERQ